MDSFSAIVELLEALALGLISALILYLTYRVGYQSGFDAGVRSEAREFYKDPKGDRP